MTSGPSTNTPSAGAGRVLIIDDDDLIASTLPVELSSLGLAVNIARDRDAAFELLGFVPFDVIVVDCYLTAVSPAEATHFLGYVLDQQPEAFTILLTAYASKSLEKWARAHGVALVLDKPQHVRRLAEIVSTALRHHHSRNQRQPEADRNQYRNREGSQR